MCIFGRLKFDPCLNHPSSVVLIRSIASQSLELLRQALPSFATRYPPLFSLPVYGSVIGMFEVSLTGSADTSFFTPCIWLGHWDV